MQQPTLSVDEQEAVLSKARELSALFREIGPKYDEMNCFAAESIEAFKASGLAGLTIPKEYGGLGGDILTTSKVVTEMSRGDSAIALAYNMHYITVALLSKPMSDDQKQRWLPRIAAGEIVFGPFSEARAGFSGLADTTAVPQPEGGWRLYGTKTWGTLSEAADLIGVNATISDADGNPPTDFGERITNETVFITEFEVDADGRGDGVRIERTWNALGMHATGTHVIHFDGFYIPEDGKVSVWRLGAFSAIEWAGVLFASIYYGMQLRILEEVRAALAHKTLGATFGATIAEETRVASIGHIVDGVGEIAARAELCRRVLYQTCDDILSGYAEQQWPLEMRMPYLGLAKTFTSDTVTWAAKKAMSLVGGSSFRHGTIFERLYRDSMASVFQPLTADQTYTYLGERLLQPEQVTS